MESPNHQTMKKFLIALNRQIQKFKNLPQKWLIIAGLALIALITTLLATQPLANSIASTDPADGATEIPLDFPVTVTFKKPVSTSQQSSLVLNIHPAVLGNLSFSPDSIQTIWKPKHLYNNNTLYTITISGQNLKTHTFTFRTRPAPLTAQLFPNLLNSPNPTDPADPKQQLLAKLPFRTDIFTIQYTILGDNIYVTIHQEPIESQKEKALNWLKTFGFDNPETQLRVRYNIPNYLNPDYLKSLTHE
jgi:hypothetical protein